MSLMLEPEEVDDEYFTPVASTTLASIFKDESSKDVAVNPSLKYKPAQPKRPANISKSEDPNTSTCEFSCSVIAYEWVQEAHKCKGKVGFAMVRIVKTGLCKIILYSQDKTSLSCTTIVPQLEVTLKGAMISLYDDHKKYWGLCFHDQKIEQVKKLLNKEKVIIKKYPEFKPEMEKIENVESDNDTDETDNNIMVEDNMSTPRNDKTSILTRIANVGHAILPSLPESPIKKSIAANILTPPEISRSADNLNVLSDESSDKHSSSNTSTQDQTSNNTTHDWEPTKNIAIQGTQRNNEKRNIFTNSSTKQIAQTSVPSVPLVNNQIFTYVNGYMVPLHMQVPVINNVEHTDTSADFDLIIQKLTHLQGVVRTMEMMKIFQNKDKKINECTCKFQKSQDDATIQKLMNNNEILLKRISELEQSIREKDENILKLQNEVQNEIKKNGNLKDQLHQQLMVEKSSQDVNMKDVELNQLISKQEADSHLANTIKSLMNDTFRSLASNFDNDISYDGNSVKAVLAAIIKKKTVESLSILLSKQDSSTTAKTKE